MNNTLQNGLRFKLRGKFAQFKKYYSNSSSFTYDLPPRTVLSGMIASILGYSRDSYYEKFSPDVCKIAVGLRAPVRAFTQCMNYLKDDGGHTQVRLQVLTAEQGMLQYEVFLFHEEPDLIEELTKKLSSNSLGYGIYMGQRPFRASIDDVTTISADEIEILSDFSGQIESATYLKNIRFEENHEQDIECASMPIHFEKMDNGRKPLGTADIVYERTGQALQGDFREVMKIQDTYISAFTPINE